MNQKHFRFPIRAAIAFALLAFSIVAVHAQNDPKLASIQYRLSMSRPVSHLFEVKIEVEVGDAIRTGHLDFQMPRWSPGRYSVFDFAKNVQEVQAAAGICPPGGLCDMAMRPVTRVDDQTWRVELMGSRSMTLSYKVFGDDLSGTFSQLDPRHAHVNGGTVFMYVVGYKPNPVKLSINAPQGWRVVNAATKQPDQREFAFANYDLLVDTPTEIAPDWTVDEFKVDGKNYRVVVHSFGDEGGRRPTLVSDLEKIVRAETKMWGEPEFDSYTFIIHFAADDRSYDGMEHLNSTHIVQPWTLAETDYYDDLLETSAHEFFHVWNVKRLRPVELGPWDFTRPAATRGLWVAEGVTTYYGVMMLRRAGLFSDERTLQSLQETIGEVENGYGRRMLSVEDASVIAPFLDGALDVQRTNQSNTTVSYYDKGQVVALVLDLWIRSRTAGKASLDDVMRRMYQQFYLKSANASYYLRGRGFTNEEFERVTSEVAGTDMSEFFNRYVRGVEQIPYEAVFRTVGLNFVREPSKGPSIGVMIDFEEPTRMKVGSVRSNSPAEDAGLRKGDFIQLVGRTKVTRDTFISTLTRYKTGDRVPLTVKRDRQTLKLMITLGPPTNVNYRIEELKDATAEQRALRAAWLSGS